MTKSDDIEAVIVPHLLVGKVMLNICVTRNNGIKTFDLYMYFVLMKLNEEEKNALIILFVGLVCVIIFFNYFMTAPDRTAFNFISLFGTLLSIVGLGIAYLQIRNLKSTTEATQKAVEESMKKMFLVSSASQLSKGNKLVQEVQESIRSRKYDKALIRMYDLHEILIEHQGSIQNTIQKRKLRNLSTTLTSDIDSMNTAIISSSNNGVSYVMISTNLNLVSAYFLELQYQIKNEI